MELKRQEAEKKLALLVQNHQKLAPDIFDEQQQMYAHILAQIKKTIPLLKREILSFIKTPMIDMVLFGELATPICRPTSEMSIGFIYQTGLTKKALEAINLSLSKRGFDIRIYRHQLKFYLIEKGEIIGPNFSLMHQKWNIMPNMRALDFDLPTFFKAYIDLNNDYHKALDSLEKNEEGYYTPQSCAAIKEYFSKLEQKVEDIKKTNPDYIYTMDYNLLRALDSFAVREHFKSEVAKSEGWFLSGESNGKI